MSWAKWILSYVFDCVHGRTTWPHLNSAGQAYVACLECGRELPYSLEKMSVETEHKPVVAKSWGPRPVVAASLTIAALLLLVSPNRTVAHDSDQTAAHTHPQAKTIADAPQTLVIGFVGGFVHKDDARHSEVQLANKIQKAYGNQVQVEIFRNRDRVKAHETIVEWWNVMGGDTFPQGQTLSPRIVLFGHSWGASTVVYVARELERDGIPVALTIQVDSVRKNGQDDSIIPANVVEAANFYQSNGIVHGRSEIVAADPSHTMILGNFHFAYDKEPAECRAYPWYDRVFFKGHTSIECDPRVWSQIEDLIETRFAPPSQQSQTEVAEQ